MAYVAILDTQLDPDAPITSGLGYQFRDNPVSIAEGALSAPRISGLALDTYVGSLLSVTTVTFTDLEHLGGAEVTGTLTGTTALGFTAIGTIELSWSTDNGSSWSAWITVDEVDVPDDSTSISKGVRKVDIRQGITSHEGSFTGTTGANAFRVRVSTSGTATWGVDLGIYIFRG